MRRALLDNLKNIPGWRTNDKLVLLVVDDYGTVRQDSASSLRRLRDGGVNLTSRFDRFDALETRGDLESLFDVLVSVADRNGRPALLTPLTLCANPDFEALQEADGQYRYETLPQSFERLENAQAESYTGAWRLWQEGIRRGYLKPQFHGREHLNVELLEKQLRAGDRVLRMNIDNRSMAGLSPEPSMPGVGFTQAFGFWDKAVLEKHREIISDGLSLFERIFGYASKTFTPPSQQLHPDLYTHVESLGVQGIDKPLSCVRRLNREETRREFNTLGRRAGQNHLSIVRNVVFEPTNNRSLDSVELALRQVAAAFRWRRPAIISSHRVNFAGHIDPENREYGLSALKRLLDSIVVRWPDIQFISVDALVDRIGETIQ